MSVRSTAENHIDEAVTHVREAINNLAEVVVRNCSGHDDFQPDYRRDLGLILQELIAIKERLN